MPTSGSAGRLAQPREKDVLITRTYKTPRETVFKAWTDSHYLKQWFAPQGFTSPHCTADPRVDGSFRYCMRSPEGKDYWGKGVYREIAVPERIVYTDFFTDQDGNQVPPSYYGMSASHPQETSVTVKFEEAGNGTKLILRHSVPEAFEELDDMRTGWNQMLDKLGQFLAEK